MFQGHSFPNINRILAGIKLVGREWRGVLLCSCNLCFTGKHSRGTCNFWNKRVIQNTTVQKTCANYFSHHVRLDLAKNKTEAFVSIYTTIKILKGLYHRMSSLFWPHHQQQYVLQPFSPLGWTTLRYHSHAKKCHKISSVAPENALCAFKVN